MEILRLATALPIGRLFDALEHLPTSFTTHQPGAPVQTIAIEPRPHKGEAALRQLSGRAADHGAELLITAIAANQPQLGLASSLPIITVAAGTSALEISNRLQRLHHDAPSTLLLAEDQARARIVDIVDREAALLGGHIIVEDEEFQLLAYSQLAGPVDEARQNAILQRQMPSNLREIFNAQGVQASLLSGEDVVRVAPDASAGLGPRLIIAIRHRGRLVGTIWFARAEPKFVEADVFRLRDAAKQLSEVLASTLRLREDEQIKRDDAAIDLLYGRSVDDAAQVFHQELFDTDRHAHVISLAQVQTRPGERPARLADFRVLASGGSWSVRNAAVTVAEGDTLHVIYAGCDVAPDECLAARSRGLAEYFTENLLRVGIRVAVGIGDHANSPREIQTSARSAARVLSYLQRDRRAEISTARDAWAPLLLDSVLTRSSSNGERSEIHTLLPVGLVRLLNTEAEKGRELIATVHEALDFWGDVRGVATRLHVHQNTVRYRLQRFTELTGIDLGDPTARLSLWLVLRQERMGQEATSLRSTE